MVRSFICEKTGLKKGTWTQEEDERLISCIRRRGPCNWCEIPNYAGLLRCGKSCRLRWLNYLRPSIKRGNFTREEDHQILTLHGKLGNKWSKIATSLPGRTDNEIKNYYHTHLEKRSKLDTNLKMKDKPRECEAVRKKVLAPRSFHRDNTGLEPQILESWPLNLLSKQETQDLSMNTITNQTTLSSELDEVLNGKSLIEYMRDESTSAFREPWFTSHPFPLVSANTDDVDMEACFSSLTTTMEVPQQMDRDDLFTHQHIWVTPLPLSESLYPNGQYDDHDMDALFEYQLAHTAY